MREAHCVRFQFRVTPPLDHDEPEIEVSILGRSARVHSLNSRSPLRAAPWVVMNISGFSDAESAWEFARRL